jgi:hypothetical protein
MSAQIKLLIGDATVLVAGVVLVLLGQRQVGVALITASAAAAGVKTALP